MTSTIHTNFPLKRVIPAQDELAERNAASSPLHPTTSTLPTFTPALVVILSNSL